MTDPLSVPWETHATEVLAIPFRIREGRVARTEADGDADHLARIAVLVRTVAGERAMVPGFGITDPTFTLGPDLDALAAALETHGPPRRVVDATADQIDDGALEIVLEIE
jgi:hypothetical protein